MAPVRVHVEQEEEEEDEQPPPFQMEAEVEQEAIRLSWLTHRSEQERARRYDADVELENAALEFLGENISRRRHAIEEGGRLLMEAERQVLLRRNAQARAEYEAHQAAMRAEQEVV
jgi:hypothetical protein